MVDDKPRTEEDFENMSDDDFLKLDPNEFSGNMAEGETSFAAHEREVANEETVEADSSTDNQSDSNNSESDESDNDLSTDQHEVEEEISETTENNDVDDKTFLETALSTSKQSEPNSEKSERSDDLSSESKDKEQTDPKDTPAKAGFHRLPEGFTAEKADAAFRFYEVISEPIRADGREITIRSPEDAIRMIQQGVNYSRRMQELKPTRNLTRMLEDHNLTDQTELSFLIDLKNGNKDAILKLIKDHNIDVMDLDPEKETGYQTPNYGGTAELNEFRDVLDTTMTTPQGQALVTHIHESWDDTSKAHIRDNPGILGNLNEMKLAGVYDKVVEELEYQRSLGYLTNEPFLKAFDQVGEAMRNAGVFNVPQQAPAPDNSMAPMRNPPQNEPVARGVRKEPAPKKAAPNPHLSSTPPSRQQAQPVQDEPAYDKMSDEEFLKMAPPS